MEITQVHYQKTVNLGNYENEKVGAWANVGLAETADEALTALTSWVHEKINGLQETKEEEEKEQHRLSTLQYRIEQAAREYKVMRDTWKRARETLQKFGFDVPRTYVHDGDPDGIPF